MIRFETFERENIGEHFVCGGIVTRYEIVVKIRLGRATASSQSSTFACSHDILAVIFERMVIEWP